MTWRPLLLAWLSRYQVPLLVVIVLLAAPLYLRFFSWALGVCPFWTPHAP